MERDYFNRAVSFETQKQAKVNLSVTTVPQLGPPESTNFKFEKLNG